MSITSSDEDIHHSLFLGAQFLLSHLSKPDFPRTIATKKTEGRQIVVGNIEGAMSYYKDASYMDCRLAAYPYHNSYDNDSNNNSSKSQQIIDLVLLDLDLNNFKHSHQKLNKALEKILQSSAFTSQNLKLNVEPTVMWTGNGYHVLIPIEPLGVRLEDMPEFNQFEEPSKKVLRWLEKYLSGGKSDSVHNKTVSFANCMLRIPGSINSKHTNNNNNGNNKVQIIREWNAKRLPIKPLMGDFLAYLLDEMHQKPQHKRGYYYYEHNNSNHKFLSKP